MGMANDLRSFSKKSAVPTALRALLAVFPALKRRAIGNRPLRGLDFGGLLRSVPEFAKDSVAPAGLVRFQSLPTANAVGYSSNAAARLGIRSVAPAGLVRFLSLPTANAVGYSPNAAARLAILCALCAGL